MTAINTSKVQGNPNPAFTASYSGFVNGDDAASLGGTLTFSTPADASSPPGTYPVFPSGLTSANYAIAFAAGTLSVTPRALTVTANNAAKTYGDPDPAFSASYSGFATGDSASSLGGTLAFATNEPAGNAPVGNYTITPSGLTSTNYMITFDTAMNPSDLGNGGNYIIGSEVIKTVKVKVGKRTTKQKMISFTPLPFSVSAVTSNSVTLTLAGKPKFSKGGQLTVVAAGLESSAGAFLAANGVFTISKGGKQIS